MPPSAACSLTSAWPELLLIGVVALVVIGPKDLPRALRVAGYWVSKARTLSREFQGSVEQMIREAELDEMRQELKKATEFDIEKEFNKTIDPDGKLGGKHQAARHPRSFRRGAEVRQPRCPSPISNRSCRCRRPANPRAAEPAQPRRAGAAGHAGDRGHAGCAAAGPRAGAVEDAKRCRWQTTTTRRTSSKKAGCRCSIT